jgi:hypothetical protein
MVAEQEEPFDIPDPEEAPAPRGGDASEFDPGGDPVPEPGPGIGENPDYDPGGLGRQPDIDEEAEDYR